MRNTIVTGFIILFLFYGISSKSYACQPCAKILSFEESVNEADLIIIGQKMSEGPRSDFGEGYGGPDWIEVKIKQVLKGEISAAKIKVNSWDAMCPYGIIVENDKDYVMLLRQREVTHEDYQFDAVNYDCGVKTYVLEGDYINFDGEKISVINFKKKVLSELLHEKK